MPEALRTAEIIDFTDRFVVGDGCWEWTALKSHGTKGYGRFTLRKRLAMAHRVSYELFVGPIPEGLQIDHLCRNTGCVRPDHLEPVTLAENVRRGEGPSAQHARKTHCVHGHALAGDNVYMTPKGQRVCKVCRKNNRIRSDARLKTLRGTR